MISRYGHIDWPLHCEYIPKMNFTALLFLVTFVLKVEASFLRKCFRCRERNPSYSNGDELMISSAVVNEKITLNGNPDSRIIPDDVIPEESEDSDTGLIRSDRRGQAESENDIILTENLRRRQLTRTWRQGCVITKRNRAFALSDTSNSAPAVQLEDAGTVVPSVPEKILVPGVEDAVLKKLEALINSKRYEEVIKLADDMNREEFLRCLCQVVTGLDHFKGLLGYLKQRKMVPAFLAHGEMAFVRKVIVETRLLKTNGLGECDGLYDAMTLSLEEDRHKRVVGLLEAAQGKPAGKHTFETFVSGFFDRYLLEKGGMPLKRFFILHGEEFSKGHPTIFKTICQNLVLRLKWELDNPASQKLLIDLVGQPSLLTPIAFAGGFLHVAYSAYRANFIKYGYKEAIEEGLKKEYGYGGMHLWTVMVRTFPDQFSGEYPNTDEARSIALMNFKPTKQDLEEQWIVNNAQNPRTKPRARQLAEYLNELGINLPIVLWIIVAEYAAVPTLLDVE